MKDNLDPNGKSRPWWKILFDNRGFVAVGDGSDGSGGGDGDGSGSGDGGDGTGDGSAGGDTGGDGGGGTGTATITDWRKDLDPAIANHPALQNFKTPQDVVKSYVEAQKLIGKEKIPVPSKDSDPLAENPAEWNTVYDRLGRPENPDGYSLPEVKYPENFPKPDEGAITQFKELGHKIGLLPHQLAALYKWDAERGINYLENHTKQVQETMQQAEAGLKQEYGAAYDANINAARGVIKKFGGDEVIKQLEATGMGNNPTFIKFMVNVAKNFGENAEAFLGEAQTDIMSPSEAKEEIKRIRADKNHPYHAHNRDNPEHKAAVERMSQLYAMAHPEQK